MIVGVPREIKPGEQRVGGGGGGGGAGGGGGGAAGAGAAGGAAPRARAPGVGEGASLVLKVKEPIQEEYGRLRRGQILFTYLHLAAVPELTRGLQGSGGIAIAYETGP